MSEQLCNNFNSYFLTEFAKLNENETNLECDHYKNQLFVFIKKYEILKVKIAFIFRTNIEVSLISDLHFSSKKLKVIIAATK
jgi:hypothetical protein